MVARNSKAARSSSERISKTNDKVDELTRSVGKGSATLRSPNGRNKLVVKDSNNPELVATGATGWRFGKTIIDAIVADGSGKADLSARAINGTSVFANRMYCNGDLSVSTTVDANEFTGVYVTLTGNLYCPYVLLPGSVLLDSRGNVALQTNNRSVAIGTGKILGDSSASYVQVATVFTNNTYAYSSERYLKDEQRKVTNGLEIVDSLDPVVFKWKPDAENPIADHGRYDTDEHVGIYVDELADKLPEAVRRNTYPHTFEDGSSEIRTGDARTYDDRGLMAVLVAAVKELHTDHVQYKEDTQAEINDLKARITALGG